MFLLISSLKYLYVVTTKIASGKDINTPSIPNNIPPANKDIIITNGCSEFVFPYIVGFIT